MNEIFDIINQFLNDEYDPLDFSYDLPNLLFNKYDEMEKENKQVTKILNNELPEICSYYERGQDPAEFVEQVREQYKLALDALNK